MSTLVKVGEEDIVLKDSKGQKKETFVSEEGTYQCELTKIIRVQPFQFQSTGKHKWNTMKFPMIVNNRAVGLTELYARPK